MVKKAPPIEKRADKPKSESLSPQSLRVNFSNAKWIFF